MPVGGPAVPVDEGTAVATRFLWGEKNPPDDELGEVVGEAAIFELDNAICGFIVPC